MDGARELGWDQVREAKFISDPKSKHGMDNRDKVQSLEVLLDRDEAENCRNGAGG